MGFQPRTFYVAVCDEGGCDAVYQNYDFEVDALFDDPNAKHVGAELASWGWLRAGEKVFCPEHAPAWMYEQPTA